MSNPYHIVLRIDRALAQGRCWQLYDTITSSTNQKEHGR